MITYRASLDVDRSMVLFVATLLTAHRRAIGTRRRRRALTPFWQAVLVIRFLRDRPRMTALARDHRLGLATAYRYRDEGITVLAARAPDLHEELQAAHERGEDTVLLDGTLVRTDRVRDFDGPDRWYSGKHKTHGGNVQVLADTAGRPRWLSPVEPGSTHDITAARAHALHALYAAWGRWGLATLADKGYIGTGAGIRVPFARRPGIPHEAVAASTLAWNAYVNSVRVRAEHAIATLKVRWVALRHLTSDPSKISPMVAAALVLTRHEKNY